MLWTFVDAETFGVGDVVVVSQVPRRARRDELTTPPTHGATGVDQLADLHP